MTDALANKTSFQYDALNRRTRTIDAKGGITQYAYDKGDNVVSVTGPRGLVTSYAHDGLGQLWQQVSPDTGTTHFVYDSYGRRSSMTRADGTLTSYGYDGLNRLTSATAGSVSRTFTYDSCVNGKGRLCSAVHVNDDTVSYSYTPEGWIAARSFAFVSGINYSLGYSYDNVGHLASVTYPDATTATYDYTQGAVADVRLKIGASNVYAATSVVYRPMDLVMSNWTSFNGLSNSIGYDSDLRPTGISVPNVESLAFSYDTANRITHITNGMDGTLTQSLGYDAMNHLTTLASTADNESYNYDADGNRIHRVVNGVATTFTMAANSNRLITVDSGTYGYDAEGNTLTFNGNTLFVYDGFGQVSGANGVWSYAVGAEGQRLRNSGPPGQTYFAPDKSGVPLAEDQGGTWLDYVYLNGRLVSVVRSGQVYSVHADQTGRPLVLANSSQAVVWAAKNLPYPFAGYVTVNSFGTFNLQYPGQYQDSGIVHNGYRDYNTYLGRYIESDPIGLAGGINTYTYAGNNPISNVDPLGLCGCTDLQKAAAKLANNLEKTSQTADLLAIGNGIATGLAGAGEGFTFGAGTPVTITFASATTFFATASFITGGGAAALKSFASGNSTALVNFNFTQAEGAIAAAAASRIPGVAAFADTIGDLTSQAAGLATQAAEVCR